MATKGTKTPKPKLTQLVTVNQQQQHPR